ncbi:triose-phosphate isomerase [Candidatus Oleimmundimicrobium sp.]|uniref:triose-phosphate isomerase n=1 Tax=Candidatus Oleimmundimicrobium sp. TaxID=3060597 RepID=UPI002723A882|nr:triose-phosphate isomerase [Candidatus Oleimmundimicrobium sp.]MDO8885707.1 triose-phosphate isomerase [Candidatus Oleimmundimicrobium sp.]
MRKPMIAGNWKMHKTAGQAVFLVQDLAELVNDIKDVDVVVCPPYIALKSVSTVIEVDKLNIGLGAQNVYWEKEGAFTGEISPVMLKDLRVDYVIVGHSERRHTFEETNEMVNKKLKAVLAHDMKPILCVGETLDEREEEETFDIIKEQIFEGLADISPEEMENVIIAYEPVWAIGTGLTATPEQANDVIRTIRALVGSLYNPEIALITRILYGGSVKPGNIAELMDEPDIDGALVGGASLNAENFAKIVKYKC